LQFDGSETFSVTGLERLQPRVEVECEIRRADGSARRIPLRVRIDTAVELEWHRNGGVC
jgi:aconitate hydratase